MKYSRTDEVLAGFLSSSWHISSKGTFAVTCIGVVLLVVCLEFLRRVGKEYDTSIRGQFQQNAAARLIGMNPDAKTQDQTRGEENPDRSGHSINPAPTYLRFRPTPLQQFIRSVIHMVTFGVAYIIMLLAMYFNGYIILMIFLGALIGKFVCDWGSQQVAIRGSTSMAQTEGEQELTYCCG
jgi:solute carrier family 31 (copper transporter), member 1